jgi:hypothetical protein
MSFFLPPVTTRDPKQEVTVEQVHQMLTASEALRQATDRVRQQLTADNKNYYRAEKQQRLPYVTPAGVFRHRTTADLVYLNGLQVIDIDHLSSPEQAAQLRDALFQDEVLRPELAFISPSGVGVKLFVPYEFVPSNTIEYNFRAAFEMHCGYISHQYDIDPDWAGSDIVRGCFLAHDPEAKIRQ